MPAAAPAISLNTAAVLTGRSLRTWQRRIEDGAVPRLGEGGARAQVPFAAVVPELPVALAAADVALLVRADTGDAAAQAELGALFALAALGPGARGLAGTAGDARRGAAARVAQHFLQQAAQQGQADAMHWLGLLHAAGFAGSEDGDDNAGRDARALMWVARAAAHGHAIARGQLAALLPGGGAKG